MTDVFKNHKARAIVVSLTTMRITDPNWVAHCTGMNGGNFGIRVHDFWEGTLTNDIAQAQKEAKAHNLAEHPERSA